MSIQPKRKVDTKQQYKLAFIITTALGYFVYHFPETVNFVEVTTEATFGLLIGGILTTAYDLFRNEF
jgi:hypothetical protein